MNHHPSSQGAATTRRGVAVGALALLLVGCVIAPLPVPVGPAFDPDAVARIEVGKTTRAEVLATFEQMKGPNVLNHERYAVHHGATGIYWMFVMVGGGGNVGPVGTFHHLLVAFDEAGVVHEVVYRTYDTAFLRKTDDAGHRTYVRSSLRNQADATSRPLGPPTSIRFKRMCLSFLATAFSPDGRRLAAIDSSRNVYIWDLGETEPETFDKSKPSCAGGGPPTSSIAFTRDGRKLIGIGRQENGVVWDLGTRQVVAAYAGHGRSSFWSPGGIINFSVSPDGRHVASSGMDNDFKIWDVETGREKMSLRTPEETGSWSAVAFSPDGRWLATSGGDDTVRLWEVATGTEIESLQRKSLRGVAFSPDGRYLAVSSAFHIELWTLVPSPAPPVAVGDSLGEKPGGVLAALHRVFLLPATQASDDFAGWTAGRSLAFSPDGRLLAGVAWHAVIWVIESGRELWRAEPRRTEDCVFCPDDYFAVVTHVTFSPDGRYLATSGNGGVHLWELPEVPGGARESRVGGFAVLAVNAGSGWAPYGRK